MKLSDRMYETNLSYIFNLKKLNNPKSYYFEHLVYIALIKNRISDLKSNVCQNLLEGKNIL